MCFFGICGIGGIGGRKKEEGGTLMTLIFADVFF